VPTYSFPQVVNPEREVPQHTNQEVTPFTNATKSLGMYVTLAISVAKKKNLKSKTNLLAKAFFTVPLLWCVATL
jgi:hypothetical protein